MAPVGSWCGGGGGGGFKLGLLKRNRGLADYVSPTGPLKLGSGVTGGRNWGSFFPPKIFEGMWRDGFSQDLRKLGGLGAGVHVGGLG